MRIVIAFNLKIAEDFQIYSSEDFNEFKDYEKEVLAKASEMVMKALDYEWPKEELPHMRNLLKVKCNDEYFLARVEDYINNLIHNLISPPPFEKETVEA